MSEERYVREEEFDDFKAEYRRDIKELYTKVDNIGVQVSGVGKTSTKEWLMFVAAVGGFALVIVVGLWSLAIQPIAQRQDQNVASIREVEQQLIKTNSNVGKIVESLKEVETQFEAKYVISNLEIQAHERFLSMVWSRAFPDVPYPDRQFYPLPSPARGPTLNGH